MSLGFFFSLISVGTPQTDGPCRWFGKGFGSGGPLFSWGPLGGGGVEA